MKAEDVEREAIADKKRDEQIESAKKIIPKIEDGNPQKSELLFQLAELYWDKSRYLYRREMLKFFEQQKEADEKKNRGDKVVGAQRGSPRVRALPLRDDASVRDDPARVPEYERKDEVLFNLAYNLYETGKRDGAVKRYEELLKSYPGSKFVPDTYVQLGNHYFDVANVLEKARSYFEKAFATSNPRIKSYALYKLAWCDFNAGEHEKALKKLQDTVEIAEKAGAGKERVFTDLKNEALKDSVRMFVQLNRADDAIAYYKAKAGKKKQTNLIGKLAYGMQEAGHHDNAIKSFRYLLNDNSELAEAAPDFQQASSRAYEGLRQRDNVKSRSEEARRAVPPGLELVVEGEQVEEGRAAQRLQRGRRGDAHDRDRVPQRGAEDEAGRSRTSLARDIYKQYVDGFAVKRRRAVHRGPRLQPEVLLRRDSLGPRGVGGRCHASTIRSPRSRYPTAPRRRRSANEKYRQHGRVQRDSGSYDKLVKIERGVLQKL
jgi:tetratricopeptide (TPR) repeat protein